MKKLTHALASLLFFGMSAAMAEDYLRPVDPIHDQLRKGLGQNWYNSMKGQGVAFLEFDTAPALSTPSFLGIVGFDSRGPFHLCYLENSYDTKGPICAPIPSEQAKALYSRVEKIIEQGTYHGPDRPLIPVDGTSYYFSANFKSAWAYAPQRGSVPDLLVNALAKCGSLAKLAPTDPTRQKTIDEILKDLDAIKLPDTP